MAAVAEALRHFLRQLEGLFLAAGQRGGAQGDGAVAVLAAVVAVAAAGGLQVGKSVGERGGHLLLAVGGEGGGEHPDGAARHAPGLLAQEVHGAALRLAGRGKGVEAVGAHEVGFLLVAGHAAGQVPDQVGLEVGRDGVALVLGFLQEVEGVGAAEG